MMIWKKEKKRVNAMDFLFLFFFPLIRRVNA